MRRGSPHLWHSRRNPEVAIVISVAVAVVTIIRPRLVAVLVPSRQSCLPQQQPVVLKDGLCALKGNPIANDPEAVLTLAVKYIPGEALSELGWGPARVEITGN